MGRFFWIVDSALDSMRWFIEFGERVPHCYYCLRMFNPLAPPLCTRRWGCVISTGDTRTGGFDNLKKKNAKWCSSYYSKSLCLWFFFFCPPFDVNGRAAMMTSVASWRRVSSFIGCLFEFFFLASSVAPKLQLPTCFSPTDPISLSLDFIAQ